MELKEILELERRHREQQLQARLAQARQQNQEARLNHGVVVIVAQMRLATLAAFFGGSNE